MFLQPEKVKPPQLLVEDEDDLFSSAAAAVPISQYVWCFLCYQCALVSDAYQCFYHDDQQILHYKDHC